MDLCKMRGCFARVCDIRFLSRTNLKKMIFFKIHLTKSANNINLSIMRFFCVKPHLEN